MEQEGTGRAQEGNLRGRDVITPRCTRRDLQVAPWDQGSVKCQF